MKKILYTKIASLVGATLLIFSSCDDFLTRDTYDSINADEYFQTETDLELYTNGFIQNMTPSARTIGYGDINAEYVAVQTPADLLRPDGNVNPGNQGGWTESSWANLRSINYYLDNMVKAKGNVDTKTYNHYEGVGRFWRAWFYYDKVQTFGAVPFYDKSISSDDNEALFKAQDSREYVMDKILEDLNFAAENCSDDEKYIKGGSGITKWTVLAFKSRVCLFEGTYRKYHLVDPSSGKQWTDEGANVKKFLNASIDASHKIMESKKYSLVTGDVNKAYRGLFTSAKIDIKEVIWGRQFSQDLSTYHDLSWVYYSSTYGSKVSLTKTFMNTYLMLNGTPFTNRSNYKVIEFADEFAHRDARMAQTVINPKYEMSLGGVHQLYSPNWLTTRTGYHPIKWSIDSDADNVLAKSASWNALPIFRYAEILLNYAEAKAELNEMNAGEWEKTITLIRQRAGVTSVVPAEADPYMVEYFKNQVDDKWILEIRRERGIEMCLEMGLRWDDLMRWHMGELLNSSENPWIGIYIPNSSAQYDFNGDGKIDFKIVTEDKDVATNAIKISQSGVDQSFSINNDKNLVWNYVRTWSEYKYLKPIPTDAITRNPNLKQNYLWIGK